MNGITAHQTSFDDSDLFNSRFIRATLINTSFRNCNVKKTLFNHTTRTNVSFKMSNTREAIFSKDDPEFGSLDNNGEPGEKDTIGALI